MSILKPLLALFAASLTMAANAQGTAPPIGACIITVPTYSPACIPDIAQDACSERAKNNAGTPEWYQDQDCPDMEQRYIDKTGAGAAAIVGRRPPPRPVHLPAR